MTDSGSDRFPRGALVVVAIGLLVTVAVAWASNEDLISSKPLPWAEHHEQAIPPAGPEPFGRGGSLSLSSTGIDVTEPNTAGYRLFQVGAEVVLDPGRAQEEVSVSCTARSEPPTVNGRTPNRPAAYPGPIEDLSEAPWPGDVIIDYSAQSSPYSTVTLPTAYMGYGTDEGVEVEWGDWEAGSQNWVWNLPADFDDQPARLRFVSLWRTFSAPAIELSCEAGSGATLSRVATEGRLSG